MPFFARDFLPTLSAPTITRGRKVTSLGVLYDFTGNSANTTVQKVEDMVKEQWVRFRLRIG